MKHGARVPAQDRGGTGCVDRAEHCVVNGASFELTRDNARDLARGKQGRDRQRDGVRRNGIEAGKTAVIHLLLTTGGVERDDFYQAFVVKICDRRIIERDVTIFTDAEAHEIDRHLRKKLSVSLAFPFRMFVRTDEMHGAWRGNMCEQMFAQITAKALRMLPAQADVFVHVKYDHLAPWNLLWRE